MRTFWGYVRASGPAGIRNHLAIIPSVICANTVAQRIAQLLPGAVALPHPHGCCQIGDDVDLTKRMLALAAAHPNVGAALVVGLGCETCQARDVAALAATFAPGKPVMPLYIQEQGGSVRTIAAGVEIGRELLQQLSREERREVSVSELVLATHCGELDRSSSLASNPVVGVAVDLVVQQGGTALLAEAGELEPVADELAERAVDATVAQQARDLFSRYAQQNADSASLDRAPDAGGEPVALAASAARAQASLGKSGTSALREVLPYAAQPTTRGLVLLDGPTSAGASVTGLVSSGAQLCISTTGYGSALGNALAPVVRVTSNPAALRQDSDSFDFEAVPVFEGAAAVGPFGHQLLALVRDVCNGQLTAAEIIGHQEFALLRVGPTV